MRACVVSINWKTEEILAEFSDDNPNFSPQQWAEEEAELLATAEPEWQHSVILELA